MRARLGGTFDYYQHLAAAHDYGARPHRKATLAGVDRAAAVAGEGDDYAAHSRRNLDTTSGKAIAPAKPRARNAMIYRVSGGTDEVQILL